MLALLCRGVLGAVALIALLAFGVGSVGVGSAGASVPAWTTYHHDAARSGIDPDSTSPVTPTQAWQPQVLDGSIYGEPLVYGSRIYIATENNTVYALDASTGAVVWHSSAGTPVDAGALPCGDIAPTVGITSTPVIDPATNRIYVVADSWDGSNKSSIHHQLVSFDLTSGAASAPVGVDPPGSDHAAQLQRAALALDGNELVIGYGANAGDCGDYHGWLVGVNENGTQHVYESTQHNLGAGVWASGNAPAIDSSGDIYAATGNGSSSINSLLPPATFDFTNTVLKLSPNLGKPLDYWAPLNWSILDTTDADLGSSAPLLLPGGLLFQAGKDRNAYLVRTATGSMGKVGAPAAQLNNMCQTRTMGGGIYVAGTIYAACTDGLQALTLDASKPSLSIRANWVQPDAVAPPIYAAGLIWSGDRTTGMLDGLDPTTGAVRSQTSIGDFKNTFTNHFPTPSAGGGRLFIAVGNKVTALKIANYVPSGPGSSSTPGSSSLSMSHVSLTRRTVHGKHATKLKLTLSEPAKLTVKLLQRLPGRKVNGRCSGSAHHGLPCLRKVRRRVLTFSGLAGVNTFTLRLAGLRPGSYDVVVSASGFGEKASKTLRLTIKPPRPHRSHRSLVATVAPVPVLL